MRIVLDQDEVIVQWLTTVLEWYNHDFGTTYVRDDVTCWKVTDSLPNSHHFLRSTMRYPDFYRDLLPVEGAINGVKKLMDAGHDVVIATAIPKCAPIAHVGKLEWIRRNMPFFPLDNFISISRKDLLAPGADVLLDDGLHNIMPWSETGKTAVVFDAPWNRPKLINDGYKPPKVEKMPDNVLRVKHWNEFLRLIEDMKVKR